MYIRFELTDTDMVFKLKDEAGTDIETHTFAISDYQLDPYGNLGSNELLVQPVGAPKNAWPPAFMCPKDKLVFINSTTGVFQPENEMPPAEP